MCRVIYTSYIFISHPYVFYILYAFDLLLSCDYVHLTHKYTQKGPLGTLQSWCSFTKIELLPELGAEPGVKFAKGITLTGSSMEQCLSHVL